MALILRVQLSHPNATVVTGDAYNELFTMHGTVMLFLFLRRYSPASRTTSSR